MHGSEPVLLPRQASFPQPDQRVAEDLAYQNSRLSEVIFASKNLSELHPRLAKVWPVAAEQPLAALKSIRLKESSD